jgi:transcriptional regulator with XRE-family HTH domain
MTALNPAKVIRRVRKRLEVSQEGLSRLLNATKGAIQHWERGRNRPDLARLIALRQICPPSAERKELDALLKQVQAEVAPLTPGERPTMVRTTGGRGPRAPVQVTPFPREGFVLLRRENVRLRRQVAKLETALERRGKQLRILEDLAKDLQREMAELRAASSAKSASPVATPDSARG